MSDAPSDPNTIPDDDPRRLRSLLEKAREQACNHEVPSVVVGLAAGQGDVVFPVFIEFLGSALRVEDGIFRMTRDRAIVHLADVGLDAAREVIERLVGEFERDAACTSPPGFHTTYFEICPGDDGLSVKDVLTGLFPGRVPGRTLH